MYLVYIWIKCALYVIGIYIIIHYKFARTSALWPRIHTEYDKEYQIEFRIIICYNEYLFDIQMCIFIVIPNQPFEL